MRDLIAKPLPPATSRSLGVNGFDPDTLGSRSESAANPDATAPESARERSDMAISGIQICDWDDLLNAVKDRLRSSAEATASWPQDAGRFRNVVLECVAALDQLHASGTYALARSQRLEIEMFDAQCSLDQLRTATGREPGK